MNTQTNKSDACVMALRLLDSKYYDTLNFRAIVDIVVIATNVDKLELLTELDKYI